MTFDFQLDGERRASKVVVLDIVCVSDPLRHPDGFNLFRSDKCMWVTLAHSYMQLKGLSSFTATSEALFGL